MRKPPGERGATDTFQASILECVVQPLWVVDHGGLIRFANPSAAAALGYAQAADLLGKPSHQTIHYKRPDGSAFPVEECPMLLPRTAGQPVHAEDWFVRRDGSFLPVEYWSAPIDMPDGRGAVVAFTDVSERRRLETVLRERDMARAREAERRRAEQELMASRARLVSAFDAARQRIARDIHDGAQQRFVSTVVRLQLAQQKWEADPARARELLDLAVGDVKAGIDELRGIAAGIHPVLLAQRGLAAALTAMTAGLPIPVQLQVPERRLPDPVEASVYFFCAEALTNVAKHARAGAAWLAVAADDDRCTIEVRDDGIGGARARSGASGLTGLRDRIDAAGGDMEIVSPAGGGTVLKAWIPLP